MKGKLCFWFADTLRLLGKSENGERGFKKMTNPSKKYHNREPLSNEEIQEMINKAEQIRNEYFRLRVKALISLLKKVGKRKAEIQGLKLDDLKIENGYLFVTFIIRKKHKLGLFQYLKFLKKTNPAALNKNYPELVNEWHTWRSTEQGTRIKEEKRTKKVSVMDRYAKFILEYLAFVIKKYKGVAYLFPSGHSVFGQSYVMSKDKALSGRQLLNLIKPLNHRVWLHLFREFMGKEIAEADNSIQGVYKVRESLDLEQEETAWRYIKRYGVQEVKTEA